MRVEQACRFRLDGGYCIFAKSEGFGPEQEKGLADVFNDSMNAIFPKIGSSILSCAVGKTDVFFARNTLRTDIHGRMTIFTHAYTMPSAEYASLLQTEPHLLLSVPLRQLLETQSQGVEMESLDLSQNAAPMDLEELKHKYNLTPDRYSRLLLGAYEAITSNNSLRLKTSRPIEETEQMVRELTYCVLQGLLPVLKGRISFSSGADTRMSISTCCGGNDDIRSTDLVFGVEDDRETNIRPKDELSAQTFEALGRMDQSSREQTLQKMENWLSGVTNINEGLSIAMVCAAYFLSSGQEMNQDSILSLFKSFAAAAVRSIPANVADSLLTTLLVTLNADGVCSPKALSQIAGWYLRDSSDRFRAEADKMLQRASESVGAALVNAALQQPMTDNVRQMLRVLLRRLPADSEELDLETQEDLVRWIIQEDEGEFLHFCSAAMNKFTVAHICKLAEDILANAQNRPFLESEDAILIQLLACLTTSGWSQDFVLSTETCNILDAHMASATAQLLSGAAAYFLNVRMAADMTLEEKLGLFASQSSSDFIALLEQEMAAGHCADLRLWEAYQTNSILCDGMTVDEIILACNQYNTFLNPEGPFEAKAASLWFKCVSAQLALLKQDNTVTFGQLIERTLSYLDGMQNITLSEAIRNKMTNSAVNAFWGCVTYRQIYNSNFYVPKKLCLNVPNAAQKMQLINLCEKLMDKPMDAQGFIDLITSQEPGSSQLASLQAFIYAIAIRLATHKRFVSWDLLLLACWESAESYDFDKFMDCADRVQEQLTRNGLDGRVRSKALDSQLLSDANLRKAVIKLAAYEISGLLETMIHELKTNKKGAAMDAEPERETSWGLFGAKRSNDHADQKRSMQDLPQRADPQSGSKGGFFNWKGKK